MKARHAIAGLVVVLLVGLSLPAWAVPALQLHIPGSVYDPTTETWVTDQANFSLWVVGAEQHKYSVIDDVMLYIALPPGESGAPAVRITDSGNLSTTLAASAFGWGMPDGLSPHGIYPTPYAAYSVRDLLVVSAGVLVQDYAPGATGTDVGDIIEVLTLENLGLTDLHFDVTGTGIYPDGSKTKFIFAAYSHDAEGHAPVPEPGTLLLLGSGLLGAAPWARRRAREAERAITRTLWILGCVALLAVAPPAPAEAVQVTHAYLFSVFGTVPGPSGAPPGVGVPFTITGTDGVELFLNSYGLATSSADIGTTGPFSIGSALTYVSHTGTINLGEGFDQAPGVMGPRVNSEIRRLDDVGLVADGTPDAALNTDFTDYSTVTLAIPAGGLLSLMIADDAGLDPFKLRLCPDAACGSYQTLFKGFSSGTQAAILGRRDFDSDDFGSDIDQVFLFLFDHPITGFLRIAETTNPGGTMLEVDFVGGAAAPIPEPGTLLLLGSGLLGAAGYGWRWARRR